MIDLFYVYCYTLKTHYYTFFPLLFGLYYITLLRYADHGFLSTISYIGSQLDVMVSMIWKAP